MKDKLTLDASGQYRRDLGWKPGRNGGYTQHRFYLGRDHDRPQRLCREVKSCRAISWPSTNKSPGMEGDWPLWMSARTTGWSLFVALTSGLCDSQNLRPPTMISSELTMLNDEHYDCKSLVVRRYQLVGVSQRRAVPVDRP